MSFYSLCLQRYYTPTNCNVPETWALLVCTENSFRRREVVAGVCFYWDRKWRRNFVPPLTTLGRPGDVLQEHWIGSVHSSLVKEMMTSIKDGVPVRGADWPDSFAYIREVTQLLETEHILPWGATECLPRMFGLESER